MSLNALLALATAASRRPWRAIGAWIVVLGIALAGADRMQQEQDILTFLPHGDPDVRLFREVSDRFGALRVALIGVSAPKGGDVFSAEVVTRLARADQALRNVRGVDRVMALTSMEDVVATQGGVDIVPLVPGPPANAEAQRQLKARVLGSPAVGSLVSADGSAALILVYLTGSTGSAPVDELRAVARQALAPLDVVFGGAPFAGQTLYEEAGHDVRRLAPLALLALLLVILVSFRDVIGVLLTTGTVALGTLVVLGALGFAGEHSNLLTAILPVLLFASGSAFPVLLIGRYYVERQQGAPPEALAAALREVAAPLTTDTATTAIGFVAFVVMDVRPMRVFGLACGFGIAVIWLMTFTLVPAVLTLFPRKAHGSLELARLGSWLARVFRAAERRAELIALGSIVVAGGSLVLASRVEVRMAPSAFFREGSDPWRTQRLLEERFGGATFVQLEVAGDIDDPATLREIARLAEHARALPQVTQVSSVLDPLLAVSESLGIGRRLPETRAQTASLHYFLLGQAAMPTLVTADRRHALLHVRVRGEPGPVIAALERYATDSLQPLPGVPTRATVAERALSVTSTYQGRASEQQLLAVARDARLPAGNETGLRARFGASLDTLLFERSIVLPAESMARVSTAAPAGASALEAALIGAVPADERAELSVVIARAFAETARAFAVTETAAAFARAAGLQTDDTRLRRDLEPIADDLFAQLAPATVRISARVSGEPILDRGFARSVGRNQLRASAVAVVLTIIFLAALFRSWSTALIAWLPAQVALLVLFGALGLSGHPIDLGTTLVTGVAIGVGADFGMHCLWALRSSSIERMAREVGPSAVVAVVLIALAFLSLSFGRSPVTQLFGMLACLSTLASTAFACVLLPACLALRERIRAHRMAPPTDDDVVLERE